MTQQKVLVCDLCGDKCLNSLKQHKKVKHNVDAEDPDPKEEYKKAARERRGE